MKQKHILIIYTGGTIGMQPSDIGYRPNRLFSKHLLKQLGQLADEQQQLPEYTLISTEILIDSANIKPQNWLEISHLLSKHWQDYDGFIVLHGTDTLSYTASALSFMLGAIDKPVILTGSQIPLGKAHNDALTNVTGSLILAANHLVPEVCVYFAGSLWRGNRSSKLKNQQMDAFYSPNFPALAKVAIDVELRDDLLLPSVQPNFREHRFNNNHVAIAIMYPGISHQVIDGFLALDDLRALIILTFGVGNPPDHNKVLMERLRSASAGNLLVVNHSQCPIGKVQQGSYASGAALREVGAIGSGDLTLEATFTKLQVLFAQGYTNQAVAEKMPTPIRGECSI